MSDSATQSVPPKDSAAHGLLHAESSHLLGKYRVALSQIKSHPLQRPVDEPWVNSLYTRFNEVGIDRYTFPIKVILQYSQSTFSLVKAIPSSSIPNLPTDVDVLVYQGQHRVAACRRLTELEEHWWIAEVYAPGTYPHFNEVEQSLKWDNAGLATEFPAEFVTLMHMGNEDLHRLSISDADRFLSLHRLSTMHKSGTIPAEVYQVNHRRILQAVLKDATRQGLANLVCSEELADAIANALQYHYVRASFNAGTWGKKLVKGRFFKLTACLIEEMLEQCRLLTNNHADVSAKPFQLPAPSCSWTQLEKSVKKKQHPWTELPGGATEALSRIRTRNPEFSTVLNPSGDDEWTLPSS
ncbi:hypothetical protein FRC07_012107, partial [Ceratobasidium sp. 392]